MNIKRKLSYPISKLLTITAINSDSLIELTVHENDVYTSKKTTINDFANFVITAHPIFNNLHDLFNTAENSITFLKPTYFKNRPYVEHIVGDIKETNIINSLQNSAINNNNLVTLYDVKERIRNTGIAVQAAGPSSIFKKFNITSNNWVSDEKPTIITDNGYMKSIYDSKNCVEFIYNSSNDVAGYSTKFIKAEKDMFVHVIANLLLRETYDFLVNTAPKPYFNNSLNNWLGIIFKNNIIASLNSFHEIFKIHHENKNYAMAQVQISMPIAKNTQFRLFTPASLNTTNSIITQLEKNSKLQRSLFNGINKAFVYYFDENID